MRYLLIDRITDWQPGVRAGAVKTVALSEDFFEEHFPTRPILPGALIIEGLAQLAGLMLEEGVRAATGRPVKALLTIVERAKFRRTVHPGDRLDYEAEMLSVNELGGRVRCRARRDAETIADATLVLGFQEVADPRLEERRQVVLDCWLHGRAADA
jgi:3-hydroxyacyl-[acyl-carrier-protein] dehydratase